MVKRNKANKTYISMYYDTITPTTASTSMWSEFMINLNTLIDTISSLSGGNKIQISNIQVKLRAEAAANKFFCLQPLLVQTAGNWTDNVSTGQLIYEMVLDNSIDDLFGYDLLGDIRVSKIRPTGDGTTATLVQSIETQFTLLPKHLLILNRHSDSERFQDLLLGFIGLEEGTNIILFHGIIQVDFIEVRQKVIVR